MHLRHRRIFSLLSSSALIAGVLLATLPGVASAATCTETGFERDGINLTAARIGGAVTGTLDATGCNIGAYFDAAHPGDVVEADIFGANYFGVLVNGTVGSVSDSMVHDIGEVPLNGAQHGNAIVFLGGATGRIGFNDVYSYQKNGITVSGEGTSASVVGNNVIGEGPVDYIAQNGIQISFGAQARLEGNDVSLNNYTPPKVTACGLLIYKADGVSASTKSGMSFIKAENNFHDNETDICNFGKGGGFSE
jgi:hypothetical protein